MTATLEQTQADLLRFIDLAQKGEEVVITSQGRPLAKLTALPKESTAPPNRGVWLTKLARLRQTLVTAKVSPSVEQLLDEDRGS